MPQPKFIPEPGQVDFTNIRYCPVTNCILIHEDKILLVRRSSQLRLYPGYWNGVSGFLDDNKSVEEKVRQEISEELGYKDEDITSINRGKVLVQESEEYKKTWIVFPVLVSVNKKQVKLDWEASDHKWLDTHAALKLKLLPGFKEVINQFF